jgi:hypothetical protein
MRDSQGSCLTIGDVSDHLWYFQIKIYCTVPDRESLHYRVTEKTVIYSALPLSFILSSYVLFLPLILSLSLSVPQSLLKVLSRIFNITVFWDAKPRSLITYIWTFRRISCLTLQVAQKRHLPTTSYPIGISHGYSYPVCTDNLRTRALVAQSVKRQDGWPLGSKVPIGSRIFTSRYCLDWLWGPPSLLSNGYGGRLFPRG